MDSRSWHNDARGSPSGKNGRWEVNKPLQRLCPAVAASGGRHTQVPGNTENVENNDFHVISIGARPLVSEFPESVFTELPCAGPSILQNILSD